LEKVEKCQLKKKKNSCLWHTAVKIYDLKYVLFG
jgi:hypothetical protein